MDAAKMTDDENCDRTENILSILLRKERLEMEKWKRGDSLGEIFLEEVVIHAKDAITRKEERNKILKNNIEQLSARNIPKMNKEQREWIHRYNTWVHDPEDRSSDTFPGGPPPPVAESGDPVARAKIESKTKVDLIKYVRVAEMAIQFYNKNHEGSDFEVVEIQSANAFLCIHKWIHINFWAKPKNASAIIDKRLFFAEHFFDDFSCTIHDRRVKITEGLISSCCVVQGSGANYCCGYCPKNLEVLHPINDGFVFHLGATFKIKERVGETHKKQFQKVRVRAPKRVFLPPRAEGPQKLPLLTNHFKVSISGTDGHFHHYSVSITCEDGTAVDAKGVGRRILEKVHQQYKAELENKDFAYDGENSLFTIGPLPQAKLEFKVILEDLSSNKAVKTRSHPAEGSDRKRLRRQPRLITYLVAINFAAEIPISAINDDFRAARLLDVILCQNATKKGCLLVRKSFFQNDPKNFFDLRGGVLGCWGLRSSFQATQGGLSVNMDVSTTVVVKPGPVIDFLLMNQEVEQPYMINWDKAKGILKGLRIKATNTNLEYKITGLSDQICGVQKFSMKQKTGSTEVEEVEITVFEYFVNHRKIPLHSSRDFPCINVGKPKRPIFIPIELCSLVSLQRYTKALSTHQRSFLAETSRQKPQERMIALTNALNNCKYNEDSLIKSMGISVTGEFMRVEGRVLAPPKVRVGNGKAFVPRNGRWNYNNKKLLEPVGIRRWAVVSFSPQCDLSNLFTGLKRCGQKMGIFIEPPSAIVSENPRFRCDPAPVRVEKMLASIEGILSKRPQLILCVLPDRKKSDIYGPWKKRTLSDLGMITQCMAPMTALHDQYLTNLLLKINVKLGGRNSMLTLEGSLSMPVLLDVKTMILGMKVSHGTPGRFDAPSIAAVVGSRIWPFISRYRAVVRTQSPNLKMIDSLFKKESAIKDAGIFNELLMEFYETCGAKPDQIIIFRDGVSESQFNQVLNIELKQIIQACNFKEDPTWCPKFMVVVAQKRHNTKFFLTNSHENVPSGTVIDNGICQGKYNDFYMCAQNGMIGTTRPTHYHVLYDDLGFSSHELHELVHSLSYVYQRSTTAISVVAPIRYAHLAASLMSQFIESDERSSSQRVPSLMSQYIKFDERSSSQRVDVNAVPWVPSLFFQSMIGDKWFSSQEGDVNVVQRLPMLHQDVQRSMFFC